MDWKLAMKEERGELKRMIALLLSLAHLADLSCGRSAAVRGFVLWLLRRAETVALTFVATPPNPPPGLFAPAGSSPAEAMRLAESFRAVARALRREVERTCWFHEDDSGQAEPPIGRRIAEVDDPAGASPAFAPLLRNLAYGFHLPDTS